MELEKTLQVTIGLPSDTFKEQGGPNFHILEWLGACSHTPATTPTHPNPMKMY